MSTEIVDDCVHCHEGVAYEVVGAEDSGDRIILPEAQVEEDETSAGGDAIDPSSNLTPETKPKTMQPRQLRMKT